MTYYSLQRHGEPSRKAVTERRPRRPETSFRDAPPRRCFVVSNLGIEPTDVRPAPERDRPSEGCQLAVLSIRLRSEASQPTQLRQWRHGKTSRRGVTVRRSYDFP